MSKGAGKGPHSIVDELADEYRADAVRRLAEMSEAIQGLAGHRGETDNEKDKICLENYLGALKTHAHSIKGTSGTFGFSGLSVIAHTLDDFLHSYQPDSFAERLDELEPLFELMSTVVNAGEIVNETTARELLSELDLPSLSAKQEKNTDGQSTVILIMDQNAEREAVARTLEILGLAVISARDGIEAIEMSTVQHPDVVLTTLHNNRLGAPELVETFAEISAMSSVPVIVLIPQVVDRNIDGGAGTISEEAVNQLIERLPDDVHTVIRGENLNRSLADKLVELGVISP